MDKHFVKPYPMWFILHLIKNEPLTFILSKAFVLLMLSAFIAFSNSSNYDWRVIAVGVVFGLIGNITIIEAHHRFENNQLTLFRNLPIKPILRLKKWLITSIVLTFPEVIVLIRYFSIDQGVDKLLGLIVLIIAFPLAVLAYQHMDNLDKEELIKAGGAVSMLFFFLTMFSIHPFIIALLSFSLCGIILKYYHYISTR